MPTITIPSMKSPLPNIKQFVRTGSFKKPPPSTEGVNAPLTLSCANNGKKRNSIREIFRGKYGITTATEVVPVYVPPKEPADGSGGNWQLRWGEKQRTPSETVYDGYEHYKSKSMSGPAKRKTYLTTGY